MYRGNTVAKILTVIAIMLLTVALVDLRMRPVLETVVGYQTKAFSVQIINTAMQEEMAKEAVWYADMVKLSYNADGQVTSVETDIVAVNRLKTQMIAAVSESIGQRGNQTLRIPIGTLLGSQLTSGRGPSVEARVIPVGYVQSEIYNEFISAGINQTMHKVMLRTTVQMVAVLPGYNVSTESSSSFCIAETVIVGSVPEGFTIINGDDSSTISKVNDYKADSGSQ